MHGRTQNLPPVCHNVALVQPMEWFATTQYIQKCTYWPRVCGDQYDLPLKYWRCRCRANVNHHEQQRQCSKNKPRKHHAIEHFEPPTFLAPAPYSFTRLSRNAFVTTDTELKLMAAAAIIGESSSPKNGYSTPAAIGTPTAL